MNILITGCAGMIGSYLTSHLLDLFPKENGNKIIGIDNLSRGKISNLKEACGANFNDLNFINGDLSLFNYSWASYFQDLDIVIHLADIVAGSRCEKVVTRLAPHASLPVPETHRVPRFRRPVAWPRVP